METGYNGWKNRQTWNVSLWINNDEGLYNAARDFMNRRLAKGKSHVGSYSSFVRSEGMAQDKTPDGIKWLGSRLDYKALSEMMAELVS